MGDPKGFLKYKRQDSKKRPVQERIKNYKEFEFPLAPEELNHQAARCLSCGVPFCHAACPLGNVVPEFNDMLYRGHYRQAYKILANTNPFPEITGRVCPALCEGSCVHGVNDQPVVIKQIELALAQWAMENGLLEPTPPTFRTGKRVAVFGSGPSGLAAATTLNQAGHTVTVYEKDDRIGGLLRYGIPDYKLDKTVLAFREKQMQAEGVQFIVNADLSTLGQIKTLEKQYNAVVLAAGAGNPRDLPIEGRDLTGIHFAMDYLTQQNRRNAGDELVSNDTIDAAGRDVVIIGGGDTGADCAGTAIRQGAKSVMQIELLPKPPKERAEDNPWPQWPLILRTASSHEEGSERDWSIRTVRFEGKDNHVAALRAVRLDWKKDENGKLQMTDVPEGEFVIKANMVLIAAGFTGPKGEFAQSLGLEVDFNGYPIVKERMQTSLPWIFTAGDMRVGPSLVVTAIEDGINVARHVDDYLKSLI